jgi:hypothetical protein
MKTPTRTRPRSDAAALKAARTSIVACLAGRASADPETPLDWPEIGQ